MTFHWMSLLFFILTILISMCSYAQISSWVEVASLIANDAFNSTSFSTVYISYWGVLIAFHFIRRMDDTLSMCNEGFVD